MDKVTHFEIPADDLERAKEFYSKVFGWQINRFEESDYYMVNTVAVDEKHMPVEVGAINGGMMKREESAKNPVIVIEVESIDEYIKNIEASGGKIVSPKEQIGDMGFYARFTDPEGNVIGIWQKLK
jgi:predicted enzyme related to lactoylglutathione lyase